MKKQLIIPSSSLNASDLISIADFPVSALDTRHPEMPEHIRKRAIFDKFKDRIIADGLETGNCELVNGNLVMKSRLGMEQFAGFVFESWLVYEFNYNKRYGLEAFKWCTERRDFRVEKSFEAYKAVGTGLITTKSLYASFYEPHSNADIVFLRKNEVRDEMEYATVDKLSIPARIQVKAIKSNFKRDIVDNVVSGKYRHVITLLNDSTGRPSYIRCHEILRDMLKNKQIKHEDFFRFIHSIQGPVYFQLDQRDIEDYYLFIQDWYEGFEKPDDGIENAVFQESASWKYRNGLIVPVDV